MAVSVVASIISFSQPGDAENRGARPLDVGRRLAGHFRPHRRTRSGPDGDRSASDVIDNLREIAACTGSAGVVEGRRRRPIPDHAAIPHIHG